MPKTQYISQVDSAQYLGILTDSKQTWTSQWENLGKKVADGASVLLNSNRLLMCIC